MYVNISQPDDCLQKDINVQQQRIRASALVSFKNDGKRTRIDRLYQHASAKIRFPKSYGNSLEAVLVNTAGGLTGGDRINWNVVLGEHTDVVATTQACEKAYRSDTGAATVQSSLSVARDSKLHWLPQETILYNGSFLKRHMNVELARDAEFFAIESAVLGREAMGEVPNRVCMKDRWRINRNGVLVFADNFHLAHDCDTLAQMNGNRVVATLLYVTNEDDETLTQLGNQLAQLAQGTVSGFSGFNGLLTGRMVCDSTYQLRKALVPVLERLRGANLPQVWRI